MTDNQQDPEFDPAIEAALSVIARPEARSEFREELRGRFLAASETLPQSPRPASSGAKAAGRRSPARWMGALLAAASILALGYSLLRPGAPEWRILEIAPGSVVKANGVSVPVDDLAALARRLQGASEIEVESGDLILQVGDLSLFDLGPETRVAFQGLDRSDPDVPIQVRASSGRLRARTGPGFPGRTMRVQADVMDVVVTGTAFAVDYEPHGTCICCLHGVVEISSTVLGPEAEVVPPDRMCLIFRNDPEHAPMLGGHPEHHGKPLKRLEERAQEIWR